MRFPAVMLPLLLAAFLAVLPKPHLQAEDASFDLFYNSLADDGDWFSTPEFGYVWHPAIADGDEKWRPYTDGYWAQTDEGWTWVSYEAFGWATYHYGRWTRLRSIGWAWVPGYQWGPGWVSWRSGDEYVGWAPLPPKTDRKGPAASVEYNDLEVPDDGYTPAVDEAYDIGPDNYCFVGIRQFGAPVLSAVLLPPQRNIFFVENTVNVTNIYYRQGGDRTVVYNTGPDFAFVSAHVDRPIQALRIDRHEDPDYLRANTHGGNSTLVRNGVLQIAAPLIARRAVNFEQLHPARVKQVIEQPQVIHGWSDAGGDPAQLQQLRERIKTQAQAAPRQARADLPPQGVAPVADEVKDRPPAAATPPRHGQGDSDRVARREAAQREKALRDQTRTNTENTAAGNASQPPNAQGPSTSSAPTSSSEDRSARRNARAGRVPPSSTPAPTPATTPRVGKAERPGSTVAQPTPSATPNPAITDRATARAARQQQRAQQAQPQPSPAPPNSTPTPSPSTDRAAARAARQQQRAQQEQTRNLRAQATPTASPNPAEADRSTGRADRQNSRVPRSQSQPANPAGTPAGTPGSSDRRERRNDARTSQVPTPTASPNNRQSGGGN